MKLTEKQIPNWVFLALAPVVIVTTLWLTSDAGPRLLNRQDDATEDWMAEADQVLLRRVWERPWGLPSGQGDGRDIVRTLKRRGWRIDGEEIYTQDTWPRPLCRVDLYTKRKPGGIAMFIIDASTLELLCVSTHYDGDIGMKDMSPAFQSAWPDIHTWLFDKPVTRDGWEFRWSPYGMEAHDLEWDAAAEEAYKRAVLANGEEYIPTRQLRQNP